MNGIDPHMLCVLHFGDLDTAGVDWRPEAEPPPRVEHQWVGPSGERLTLFRAEPRTADDLLDADAAALLAGGTFRPAVPMREGHRLRGQITAEAPAGPVLLDVVAVDGDGDARRIVLQRPVAAQPSPVRTP